MRIPFACPRLRDGRLNLFRLTENIEIFYMAIISLMSRSCRTCFIGLDAYMQLEARNHHKFRSRVFPPRNYSFFSSVTPKEDHRTVEENRIQFSRFMKKNRYRESLSALPFIKRKMTHGQNSDVSLLVYYRSDSKIYIDFLDIIQCCIMLRISIFEEIFGDFLIAVDPQLEFHAATQARYIFPNLGNIEVLSGYVFDRSVDKEGFRLESISPYVFGNIANVSHYVRSGLSSLGITCERHRDGLCGSGPLSIV